MKTPTLADVREARRRIASHVTRTPLLRLHARSDVEIWLKAESLQPIGSFKLRGALSCMLAANADALREGVYTASAGNMAQGVAYAASLLGVKATAIVPDTAPATKLEAIARLGGDVMKVPYEEWWNAMRDGGRPGMRGVFVHPFADPLVMAGNGTIALEILEDLPDLDAVLVPWGGGGLTCGIAATLRALQPGIHAYACEVEGAAPLAASLAAGQPVAIDNQRTFVDGIGGRGVFPGMWELARHLVAGALGADVTAVARAVELLATRSRLVAEGAGATPVAVALASKFDPPIKRLVCVVSGGNIDASVLATILTGGNP